MIVGRFQGGKIIRVLRRRGGRKMGKKGMGNGEWGMGNGEWGKMLFFISHSPLPTPHSPFIS
jgi:hypothetical protein